MSDFRQLNKSDVLFVAGESNKVYQHTAGLVILDASDRPDFCFDSFREHTIERIEQIPHFRWKLHQVPLGLDLPYWVEDENFDYRHHFKRAAVRAPGDREALGELVSELYARHLDRDRPLWEMWFIEGLEGGRFALLQKLHHCVMDGQGASQLGQMLCDFEPDARPRKVDSQIADARPGNVPELRDMSSIAAQHWLRFPFATYRNIYNMVAPKLLDRVSGRKTPKRERHEPPHTLFNADISSDRGFVFGTVSLSDIKRVKGAFDVTVNDVVMALVGSSMRRYLQRRDGLPDESLVCSIAVSLRGDGDQEFSNKVSAAPVTLATDQADPLGRLRAINAETSVVKEEVHGGGVGLLEVLQMLPPVAVGLMVNGVDPEQTSRMMGANLVVSNVRGSAEPMYVAGARMLTMYPMSILARGVGLNITCVSYSDGVDFGICLAPELVDQPWELIDGIQEALDEYLSLIDKGQKRRPKPAAKKKPAAKRSVKPKRSAKPKQPASKTRSKAG